MADQETKIELSVEELAIVKKWAIAMDGESYTDEEDTALVEKLAAFTGETVGDWLPYT